MSTDQTALPSVIVENRDCTNLRLPIAFFRANERYGDFSPSISFLSITLLCIMLHLASGGRQ
jgi:hypothetical protein